MKLKSISFLPAISWFFLSFYLLTLPGSAFPKEDWFDKIQLDKWVHIALFGILVYLFYQPWKDYWDRTFWKKALIISFIALDYGIAMEFVQKYLVPMRSFDIWDILADGIGSFIPFLWMHKRLKKFIE